MTLICLVLLSFCSLFSSLSAGGGAYLYRKQVPKAEGEEKAEIDTSADINAYLAGKTAATAAKVKKTATVKRFRHVDKKDLCLEAINTIGGQPQLRPCDEDAAWVYQNWNYNTNGTISNPEGTMCFFSQASRQKPKSTDPNVHETIADDINGRPIIIKPCSTSDPAFLWRKEGNIFKQDNGVGRDKCWVTQDDSKKNVAAQDSKLVTWYCDADTPQPFEGFDYTGPILS